MLLLLLMLFAFWNSLELFSVFHVINVKYS